ncbi:MAG: DNA-formamidopyrimidine glycosylase [Chloroflexi bacterium]|nr:DNA-formamidopyrimidine glycosylase [Chloroflexota bacterium]MCL5076270.1 DNA-formamidopyrimidine glycosylase [Chloroflexota bacterium]
MPELPEVETITRDLAQKLNGQRITSVTICWPGSIAIPTVDEFQHQITNPKIGGLRRRGKFIIFDLSDGDYLLVHLRMTGRLLLRSQQDPVEEHTRLILHLDDGQELRFVDLRKFGRLFLVREAEYQGILSELGPEPLENGFTLDAFNQRLRTHPGRIKPLLLDQRFIAGLGNIYADEALFLARIHPLRRAATLTEAEIAQLYQAIRTVLRSGIEDRGTTFSAYRDASGQPGAHQFNLYVYRRLAQPCHHCQTPIQRLKIGGRNAHFCPQCQPYHSESPLRDDRATNLP